MIVDQLVNPEVKVANASETVVRISVEPNQNFFLMCIPTNILSDVQHQKEHCEISLLARNYRSFIGRASQTRKS